MREAREFDDLLERGLECVRDLRSGDGEVYLEERSVFRLAVADATVESLESQQVRGAGLRIFHEGRIGFAYTTDLTDEGLRRCAGMAKDLLGVSDPDEGNVLPEQDASPSPEPDNYDPTLARIDTQDKLTLARRVEEAARATDPRVSKVRQSLYTDVVGRCGIANTSGLRHAWPFSRVRAAIELTAEEGGRLQSGYNEEFAIRFSALDAAHVGAEAARRAVQKIGARTPATRRADVVLDPLVAASLIDAIAPALCADNVLKGKSVLASRLGRECAGSRVRLIDDGRLPGGDRTAAWDDEGSPTRCTMLIDSGELKGFLHSSATSIRMGAAPTGNAFRRSFTAPPRIAPSNLYLEPTGQTRDDLLARAGDGFHITEVMGLHTIDTISGDFSLGASGVALRGGAPDGPVERIGLAGNLLALLGSIQAIATDLRCVPGGGAGSSTLLGGITISGQ